VLTARGGGDKRRDKSPARQVIWHKRFVWRNLGKSRHTLFKKHKTSSPGQGRWEFPSCSGLGCPGRNRGVYPVINSGWFSCLAAAQGCCGSSQPRGCSWRRRSPFPPPPQIQLASLSDELSHILRVKCLQRRVLLGEIIPPV